ncbi:MAG TPA: FHA domain-containing protein [Myxococcales bacterium]|nr:FHA domain-containing protein [Myxococcales bacterium]
MKLIIEDDEGRKTVVPVVRDEITIGRNDRNLIRLVEKNVSRRHGRLLREDGHYFIEDLGSFTGIRVNGERIAGKRQVEDGDLIQISEYDLILQAAPEEMPALQVPKLEPVEARPEPQVAAPKPEAQAAAEAAAQAEADARARRMAETATIRLADLRGPAGEVPAQDVPVEQRPKLVGISGKYRGEEFVLDRSPIGLGRSDENDLQVEHPSISRKHLRLHLENGSWKVMDAESRNGVRVNGESYAQIGLRHGDVLEIGHLRFVFVEHGRALQLPPEHAPISSTPPMPAQRSRTALWVGVGMGSVALLSAAIFLLLRYRAEAEVARQAEAERASALASVREAVAAHRYSDALPSLEVARRAGASAAELSPFESVEREARSEEAFRDLEGAVAAHDWERARKLLAALAPVQTFYAARAAERAEEITAGYVNLHVAAARQMRGKDDAGCLTEAQLALSANPQHAEARSLAGACSAPPVRSASIGATRKPVRTAAARPTVRSGNDAEARRLLGEGNQKLVAQDLSGAVALYQKALTLQPSNQVLGGIYRSMGIAFTRQGNIEEGAHYYRLYLPLCANPTEKAQLQKVLDDYDARRR